MRPYVIVDKKLAPDGAMLELVTHGDTWIVRVAGHVLMSSRAHGSEEELARLGLAVCARPQRVLVGGLGLGYTLRALLDGLPADSEVVIAELAGAIVEWNRGPLGPLAQHPLDDPRVQVHVGSVAEPMQNARFDCILLDVDNGPTEVAHADNAGLYDLAGSRRAYAALRPGGVLCVWSAGSDARYVRTLRAAGFAQVEERSARAHGGKAGARHVVFVATR